MNKFNRNNSIKNNKLLFSHNPPAIIIKQEIKPEIKPEIKIEELKIEELKIEEIKIQELPEIKPDVKEEKENDEMNITFPDISEIYAENIETIPEKKEIKLTKMKSLKLVVDEVILNMRKNKKDGWNI